jgi:enoyl-CoA hydratase
VSQAAFVVERLDRAAVVVLSRPEAGNKLFSDDIVSLGQTIRALGSDHDNKAIVIRAKGESFCWGRDPGPPPDVPRSALSIRSGTTEPILSAYAEIRAAPVPVIALVQGDARGFGCALAGICDLTIAAADPCFSLPEMDANLPPTLAISALLGKVPPKHLLHLVYTRDRISVVDALRIGLVSQVAPSDALEEALQATLARITDRNGAALSAVKRYMVEAPELGLGGASSLAANLLSVVLSSPGER